MPIRRFFYSDECRAKDLQCNKIMYLRTCTKDDVRSKKIRSELDAAQIREWVKEARLRWFGYVRRSDSYIKAANEMKVIGKRSRGRQKIRWSDCLSKDLTERKLKEEDAMDRER